MDFSNIKKGYKAFRFDNFGELRSWSTVFDGGYALDNRYQIYQRNKWSFRKQGRGPLCLFEHKEDAIGFVRCYGPYFHDNVIIYSVFYIPSQDVILWIANRCKTFDPIRADSFDTAEIINLSRRSTTVFADAIYVQ